MSALAGAGCTTLYGQGMTALRLERYDEAAIRFEAALKQDPERLDARVGLGIARYKLGMLDQAVEVLERVIARAPRNTDARLYLGLSYLRKGEDGPAEEQLTALADPKLHPRLAAQIARALKVLRVEYPLSDEVRSFLAASLEDEAEWERDLREAQLTPRAYVVEPFGFYGYGFPRCFHDRRGALICF